MNKIHEFFNALGLTTYLSALTLNSLYAWFVDGDLLNKLIAFLLGLAGFIIAIIKAKHDYEVYLIKKMEREEKEKNRNK